MGTEFSKHGIGMGVVREETHIEFLMDGGKRGRVISGVLSSITIDNEGSPTHTPETRIRKGTVLARLTTGTEEFVDYLDGEADGRGTAFGVLMDTVDLLDGDGVAADAQVRVHVGGYYDQALLLGYDAAARVEMIADGNGAIFKVDMLP